MNEIDIVQAIKEGSSKAGISISRLFRAADMPPGPFYSWDDNQSKIKPDTIARLEQGIDDIVRPLQELKSQLRAAREARQRPQTEDAAA